MDNVAQGEPRGNSPNDEQERLWAALPENVRRILEHVEAGLREALLLREQNDRPTLAVIRGRCPLCVLGAETREKKRELRKRDAVIYLRDLRVRCKGNCRASDTMAEFEAREPGLPLDEWCRELGIKIDKIAMANAETPRDPSGSVEEAIAKVTAAGRFFEIEGATFFVSPLRPEPVRVAERGAFPGVVAEVLGTAQRSSKFKDLVLAIIDFAHRNAERAIAEFVTGRARDGSFLLHLGAGRIVRLDGTGYVRAKNGDHGIVFSTEADFSPIASEELRSRKLRPETFPALHEAILDGIPNIAGPLTREEAQSLLLAMWLAIYLRPWATGRPVILLLGPHGSGKTTVQRQFAVSFYGPEGEVGGGASLDRVPKDLLAGAVFQSFLVRDDVTDLPPGGIDPLCRMATGTKVRLATFHETLGLTSYRARAQMFLSAASPSWLGRGDLLSRIWPIEFAVAKTTSTLTERERVERALALRPAIWAETMTALAALREPFPTRRAISRFDSFEQAVFPILERAGYGARFESALRKMPEITSAIAARAEPLLGAILALAHAAAGRWLTATALNDELARVLGVESRSRELHLPSTLVRDPLRLAQFLGKIEREGSAVVRVEGRDAHDHKKLWRLTPKVAGGDGGAGGDDPPLTSSREREEDLRKGASSADPSPPTPPEDPR